MRNSSAYFLIIITANKRVLLKCHNRIAISWLVWCWHRTQYSRRLNPGARSTSWAFQTRTWESNIRKCGKHRTYPIQVDLRARLRLSTEVWETSHLPHPNLMSSPNPAVYVSMGNITLTPKQTSAYFSHWVRETSHTCSCALPLYFQNLNSIQITHDI